MADPTRSFASLIMTVLTAVVSALALGAVAALLAAFGLAGAWRAFAVAAGMALSMRFSRQTGWSGGIMAALGTLLALFYSECLQVLMRLSAQLGLPLLEVIRTSGLHGTTQLAWLSLAHQSMLVDLVAAVLGGVLAAWHRSGARHARRASTRG